MAEKFTQPCEWKNEGSAPSESLKKNGFAAFYKPPAGIFNYFLNRTGTCLTEIQTKLKKHFIAGNTVSPTADTSIEAGLEAEIYNDTRAREYSDGVATKGNVASGNYSHAEGSASTASGNYSHAEGYLTRANGYASHAEGGDTTASNYYAHAEGYQTQATASFTHAEGYRTQATEAHSHAEGNGSAATGVAAHAEGHETTASGSSAHSEGNGAKATARCTHAEGYMTQASKDYAHAEGNECIASGAAAHAEGSNTESTAYYAHAEGGFTTVVGNYSHIEGQSTNKARTALSEGGVELSSTTDNETIKAAWATNKFALVKGNNAHGEGANCLVLSANSHAEGKETMTEGEGAHAEGTLTRATGNHSHAEGYGTRATGNFAHAAGFETEAIGEYSTAYGTKTTALGKRSTAIGYSSEKAKDIIPTLTADTSDNDVYSEWAANPSFNLAKGENSFAGGQNCLALGKNAVAYGEGCSVFGNHSIATGNESSVLGNRSIAGGYQSSAEGDCSHAYGYRASAGVYAHSYGYRTQANNYQFAAGKYNDPSDSPSNAEVQSADVSHFFIGYGTQSTRANAMRVSTAGRCYGAGAFLGSGADFGEYFEWLDGNPKNEDRRGRFVTLDGDKIRLATAEDDYILGAVSGSGCFIGNSQSEEWQGKYLKDIFGDIITQEVEIPESIDAKTGETIPAYTAKQFAVNPDYDGDQKYIGREFRKEWAPVGFHGQIVMVDDGTCQVNSFCKPSVNGVATASVDGYRVMTRIDDTHIKVLVR